ncbi:unnamed protein product [Linum tenue]|uniref:DUF4283 domain-containing protein n=1 Tax=Linum tenue TaxID=586396 RepID=A0AAV0J1E6_9ROSI|nr:unnamed protein product [Linum tenue]
MEILDLNNSTFLVNFSEEKDYLNALTGGPWVILDHRSVVAWVQLPELPIHFYHREVLFALGNLLGRTVKLDYHTEHMERGKFARIAVELDMNKPLKTHIRLDRLWQQVVYEILPKICFECGHIGHTESTSPRLHRPPPTEPQIQTTNQGPAPENSSAEPPAGYGPWMQVVRKTRKQTRKAQINQGASQGNPTGKSGGQGKLFPKTGKNELSGDNNIVEAKKKKGKSEQKGELKKGRGISHKGKERRS